MQRVTQKWHGLLFPKLSRVTQTATGYFFRICDGLHNLCHGLLFTKLPTQNKTGYEMTPNKEYFPPKLWQKVTRGISGCVTGYFFMILPRVTFWQDCHGSCHGLLWPLKLARVTRCVTSYFLEIMSRVMARVTWPLKLPRVTFSEIFTGYSKIVTWKK